MGRRLPGKDDRKFIGEGMPGMSSAEVVSDVSDKWLGMWLLARCIRDSLSCFLVIAYYAMLSFGDSEGEGNIGP